MKCQIRMCESDAVCVAVFKIIKQDNTHDGQFWLCRDHYSEFLTFIGKMPDERTQNEHAAEMIKEFTGNMGISGDKLPGIVKRFLPNGTRG